MNLLMTPFMNGGFKFEVGVSKEMFAWGREGKNTDFDWRTNKTATKKLRKTVAHALPPRNQEEPVVHSDLQNYVPGR